MWALRVFLFCMLASVGTPMLAFAAESVQVDLGTDGVAEIVSSAGEDQKPEVFVRRQDGSLIGSFLAYEEGMRSGVTVAACDLNGDGRAEIVTGTRFGAGSHVRVFDAYGKWTGQHFSAYEEGFLGGVFVACGDEDGDGVNEIITGAGLSGGPHVKVFSADGTLKKEWFAWSDTDPHGVQVDFVDGKLVTAPGKEDGSTGRRVVVDRSRQLLTYVENGIPRRQFLVSTGRRHFETPLGTTAITKKLPVHDYYWPGAYFLKDVYWNMQFRPHLYLHTAYWHNNFGHPMSSGCVNMKEAEAKWLYEHVEVGTPVTIAE